MAKESYKQFLKRTLSGMIDRLDLDEFRKDALKSRWLDQLLWLESNAGKAKKRYYALRLITIVGGVITPALVSLNYGQLKVRETEMLIDRLDKLAIALERQQENNERLMSMIERQMTVIERLLLR